ncbi:MAG: hypothetical protein LBF76_00765, partial [Holosporales bacterium]|nr:hypothetical protein [Holosporales bacterium]
LYRFIVTGKVKQGAKEVPQEFKTQVRAKVTSITSDHGRMLALLGSGVPVPFHSIESLTDTLPRRSLPRPQQTRQIDTEHATPPVEETPPAEETPPVAEGEELPLADALIDLFG